MIDRRTQRQQTLIAAGRCPRCGGYQDRTGSKCARCNDTINARHRQRYRPGRQSEQWTLALLAVGHAVALRGWP